MSDGRTTWWGKDAAWWRRERVVELGEEFGSEGPAVVDWLSCEAQAQRSAGAVKAGYRTLARGSFVATIERAQEIVRRAVEIGLLDDFTEEGRTFRARISGWASDQTASKAAARKAAQRASEESEEVPAVTLSHGESRPVTVTPLPDQTRPDQENDSLRSSSCRDDRVDEDAGKAAPDEAPLCHLLADLIVANGGRRQRIGTKWVDAERLMLRRDQRDPAEAEQLIRWCQANEFWRSNILSMPKFREKYDQLRLQSQRSPGKESPSDLARALGVAI